MNSLRILYKNFSFKASKAEIIGLSSLASFQTEGKA